MENASKALLIAGGVLISLLIMGLLVYMFANIGGYFNTEEEIEKTEQLVAFNNQFESYNRNLLRGTDVVSMINKALDNNKKYGPTGQNESNYLMQIEFEMKEGLVYKKDGTNASVTFKVGQRYNLNSFPTIKNNEDAFTDFKRRIFDCKEIRYHATTGRVNYMLFIERKMESEDEYKQGF